MSALRSRPMTIALVGQPNCGKSTLFNHLVGYKANTSNLPGTTVEYLRSEAWVAGQSLEIIDLPGTYSLVAMDQAEAQTRDFLLSEHVDAVLNVLDASLLSRSLELTLQLLELGVPTVVCLNMMDEARRKGIDIDAAALAQQLGVPVIPAVAIRGTGVQAAIERALQAVRNREVPVPLSYSADVETAIRELAEQSADSRARLSAIRRLEETSLAEAKEADSDSVTPRDALRRARGRSADQVLSDERHARAMALFEAVAVVGPPIRTWRDRIDGVLMHRTLGLVALAAILYGLFYFVFRVGTAIEAPINQALAATSQGLATLLPSDGLAYAAVNGLLQGLGGALGLVVPFLVPFLLGLALLEDVGYLPRAGYLADGLMHRIGLHGKSIIPFILGYGCSVPAVMATRILENPRDRFVTALLAVMVPCVARTTIIYGLVGYFVGPALAFVLYVINLFVIAIAGWWMTRVMPAATPGLILEIPSYKVPSPKVIGAKIWLRVKEFLRYALPILVAGSVAMSLLDYFDVARFLNAAALPFTWTLGLPLVLGVPLVFGVFRKELSLVMLYAALGTFQLDAALSAGQMFVFALFTLFYVPCIATIAVLRKEFGTTRTLGVVAATTGVAWLAALAARAAWALFT